MAYPYKKIESVFTHPNAKETFANIAKWCRMQDDTGSRRAGGSSRSTSELAAVEPDATFPQDQLKEEGTAKMGFVCKDCSSGTHDTCKPQSCECQHRTDRKNTNSTE